MTESDEGMWRAGGGKEPTPLVEFFYELTHQLTKVRMN